MKLIKLLLTFLLFSTYLLAKDFYNVGFAQDTFANDWRFAQVNELKEEAKKYPYLNLVVKDAKASVANQIADIEFFIDNGYDFIITSPINAEITSVVLKKALDKEIKVILISRTVNSDDYTTFIAPNNRLIASRAAKYMAKRLKGRGTILMIEGLKGTSSAAQRREGFLEVMKGYPNIKIIKRRGNYLRSDSISIMEDIYKKNIKFDAIYSHSDSMLSGIRSVMKKEGKDLSILMVGIDYILEAKEAILNSQQSATFTYPTSAKEGIKAIVDIIEAKSVKKTQIIKSTIVTKENVKMVTPIF